MPGEVGAPLLVEVRRALGRPIDGASFFVFRFVAGLSIAYELVASLAGGQFAEYVEPSFHFSYPFFEWLHPWPPGGMAIHWAATIVLALLVAAGAWTRVAAPARFLAWTSLFLMERSEYLNHAYLYCWITFWLAVLPVGQAFSIDAWRRPERVNGQVPVWVLGALGGQMAVVYVFAGIAKLDHDWLSGAAMQVRTLQNGPGELLSRWLSHPVSPRAIAWGGLVFDLAIVPALLWRRTRAPAFAVAIAFHLANAVLFGLKSFPWFSIVATTLFLHPSWPRRTPFGRWMPILPSGTSSSRPVSLALVAALGLCAVVQIGVPLRHWAYAGSVSWTEAGYPFSWRMLTRAKHGFVLFEVVDPRSHDRSIVDPSEFLTDRQAARIAYQPDMILQFAHFLADEREREWGHRPRVYAKGLVSLNRGAEWPLVNPNVDLAAERWTFRSWPWVLPRP